jgi:hypothetical protein
MVENIASKKKKGIVSSGKKVDVGNCKKSLPMF